MANRVDVSFDCRPLRTVGRLDIPLDASPKFRQFCERVKSAIERHGSFNTYYLYNGRCAYHLTNDPNVGTIEFRFEGTAFTDEVDAKTVRCDLSVEEAGDTCDWLTQPISDWLRATVERSVRVEFDRYIAAGDLSKAVERIAQLQAQADEAGGFVGMFL
ncbi:MAG: hypothetical protein DCC68_23030 [Planctomycetota bacterium]|nr:MAG: hypothetical protein DCC68_23030 [Planctomycetota bacterium]